MRKIEITADQLVSGLLNVAEDHKNAAVLDSCGVGQPGSNLLIAGIDPVEIYEHTHDDPAETLQFFDEKLAYRNLAAIFTISYDFGMKLQRIKPRSTGLVVSPEPDIYLGLFDCLLIHNYDKKHTFLSGNPASFDKLVKALTRSPRVRSSRSSSKPATVNSNFTKAEYLNAIHEIKELIRSGETYQTNLTQQLSVELADELAAAEIFWRLRRNHPAAFAAYIDRGSSKVVSASPERFVRVSEGQNGRRNIIASPIKGTRPRGLSAVEDNLLRTELLASEKDRAENTMIVDLMRNDLGRICDYGSVLVDALCELEEHPTLFHLVSTVRGMLREEIAYSDIVKAVFPCGSITGAPKIRTMQIIEVIENTNRGLPMGAIGYRMPEESFGIRTAFEMSVAIRTMVVRDQKAVFNVGGGIVIDSDAEREYDESILKAKALLNALQNE